MFSVASSSERNALIHARTCPETLNNKQKTNTCRTATNKGIAGCYERSDRMLRTGLPVRPHLLVRRLIRRRTGRVPGVAGRLALDGGRDGRWWSTRGCRRAAAKHFGVTSASLLVTSALLLVTRTLLATLRCRIMTLGRETAARRVSLRGDHLEWHSMDGHFHAAGQTRLQKNHQRFWSEPGCSYIIKLLGAPGIATRSKDATSSSWHYQ